MSKHDVAFGVGTVVFVALSDGKQFLLTHEAKYKVMTDRSVNVLRDSSGTVTDGRMSEAQWQVEVEGSDFPPELCDRYLARASSTAIAASLGLHIFGTPSVLSGGTRGAMLATAIMGGGLTDDVPLGTYIATADDAAITYQRTGPESVSGARVASDIFSGTAPTLSGTGDASVMFVIARNTKAGTKAEYSGNPTPERFRIVMVPSVPDHDGLVEIVDAPECVPEGGGFESTRLEHRSGTLSFIIIGGKLTRTTGASGA